jgi:uncharacterized protein YjdB
MSMRALILAVTGFVVSVAACSSYDGTSVVEVNKSPAHVASVSVTLPSTLTAGQRTRGVAITKDSNGAVLTNRRISWFTSSGSVASVTDSGMISAVAPGTAVLSAVSEGVSGQATMAVLPPPPNPVATVAVAVTPSAVVVGQTATATATLTDSSGNLLSGRVVSWSSSNTTVATVDAGGIVAAKAAGSAMIQATSEGKTSASSLSVSAPAPIPVASVSVSPPNASLQVGASTQLAAVTRDANGNVLTGRVIAWSSANTGIATVSTSGLVTAVAAGSVSVTASSEGQVGSSAITVSAPAPVPVASVTVAPTSSSLVVGATVQLSATTRDAGGNVLTGRVVTWSSSSPAIASVNASGLVTAVAAGSATITATSETKTGTTAITVTAPAPVPVATVSVSPSAPSLVVGSTVQLSATTRDANNNVLTGRVITWSSANAGIASVSSNGLVTAVTAGTIQITATSEGITGSASVTVTVPPPPPPPGSWNEPTGMTVIDQRPFNSLAEHAAPYSPAWDTDTSLSIVQDATAPISPNNVIRATFPAGFHSGTAPGHAGVPFTTPVKTLYIRFAAKLSSNWQGEDSGFSKYFYAWINGHGDFFFASDGVGNSPLQPYSMLQAVTVFPQGNGNWGPNLVPSALIIRGQWQTYEFILVGNTAGTADGSVDAYLDGVHTTHVGGIQWTSGDGKWDTFEFRPIWGGTGSTLVQQTQTMDWDHVYLSGKN